MRGYNHIGLYRKYTPYNHHFAHFSESLLVATPLVIILLYVMVACEQCTKPVTTLVYYLHRVHRHRSNVRLYTVIAAFSLQLLNQQPRLTAMNFLVLNFECLKNVNRFGREVSPFGQQHYYYVAIMLCSRLLPQSPRTWSYSYSSCPRTRLPLIMLRL